MRDRGLWVGSVVFALGAAGCGGSAKDIEDAAMRKADGGVQTKEEAGSKVLDGASESPTEGTTSVGAASESRPDRIDASATLVEDVSADGTVTHELETSLPDAGASDLDPSSETPPSDVVESTASDRSSSSSDPGSASGTVTSDTSSDVNGPNVSSTDAGGSESTSSDPTCDGGVCSASFGEEAGPEGESCPPSCIAELFTSCVPSGHAECTNYSYGELICWPNGAYQEMVGSSTGSSGTVYHANGDVCLSILTERQLNSSFEVLWRNGDGAIVAEGLQEADGDFVIQCSGSEIEHFVPVGTDCSPFYLPFLDAYVCSEYSDGEPPSGTCGN